METLVALKKIVLKLGFPEFLAFEFYEYAIDNLIAFYQYIIRYPKRLHFNSAWKTALELNRANFVPHITYDPFRLGERPVWPNGDRRIVSDIIYLALRMQEISVFKSHILFDAMKCTCENDFHEPKCCFLERFLIHAIRFTGHDGLSLIARAYRARDRTQEVFTALCYQLKKMENVI